MDVVSYLREVDVGAYSAYRDLAIGYIFCDFFLGSCNSKAVLHGCEYVLMHEDKHGDLMLRGDVPWE